MFSNQLSETCQVSQRRQHAQRHTATHCNTLQHTATHDSMHSADSIRPLVCAFGGHCIRVACCNASQCVAVCCSMSQCIALYCRELYVCTCVPQSQCVALYCRELYVCTCVPQSRPTRVRPRVAVRQWTRRLTGTVCRLGWSWGMRNITKQTNMYANMSKETKTYGMICKETNMYAMILKQTNMYAKMSKDINMHEDIHGKRFQNRTIHMKKDLQNRPMKDKKKPTKETYQNTRHHHMSLY